MNMHNRWFVFAYSLNLPCRFRRQWLLDKEMMNKQMMLLALCVAPTLALAAAH